MGKMKNKQRLHQKAARAVKQAKQKEVNPDSNDVDMEADEDKKSVKALSMKSGLFKGTKIDITNLTKDLPDFDTRTVITSKSLQGMQLKKKEKRDLKKEFWSQKVELIQAKKKEDKAKKKREKTAITGDLKPLEDTLPTLDLLMRDYGKTKNSRPEPKGKAVKKTKQRQKDMMQGIAEFKQIFNHPAFKEKPSDTVLEHLKRKQSMGLL